MINDVSTNRCFSILLVLFLLVQIGQKKPAFAQNLPKPSAAEVTESATVGTEAAEDRPEPKFIWGILLNVVLSKVGSLLMDWAVNKLTVRLDLGFNGLQKKSEAIAVVPDSSQPSQRSVWELENIILGEPPNSLKLENGQESFQGLVVSLAVFDAKGQPLEFRPINALFKTGEKFKLRVLSTFDGRFTVEAQSPSGARQRLFPQKDMAVQLPRGQEILIPTQADLFFEFSGQTGEERLLIAMSGAQAGTDQSIKPVYRKDDNVGSFFVQESAQQSPIFIQILKLKHD